MVPNAGTTNLPGAYNVRAGIRWVEPVTFFSSIYLDSSAEPEAVTGFSKFESTGVQKASGESIGDGGGRFYRFNAL